VIVIYLELRERPEPRRDPRALEREPRLLAPRRAVPRRAFRERLRPPLRPISE
jgi:hypothetical protein